MQNLFFFGTLRYLPLLATVLGRPQEEVDVSEARLHDHAVYAVPGEDFPMITAQSGATAVGLLAKGLSEADVEKLKFYEGSYAYGLSPVTLADGQQAEVFFPPVGRWQPAGDWSLDDWIESYGAITLIAASEVMSYFGTRSTQEVSKMFSMIFARAASVVRAAGSEQESNSFRGAFELEKRTRSYAKFFALDDIEIRHERFDGRMSDTLDRGVFVAADAAFVFPYDPVRDRVLVIEQVRMGPILRGDKACWHMEPIAGRIDAGETPEEAARREALEEAGLTVDVLERIGCVYPTAGSSPEYFYLLLGLVDLPDTAAGAGGLASENEDIRGHLWSFDELMQRVTQFDVANAMLVTSAYYLAHHRDRLRSVGAGATP